ncbi:hypothetical protein RHSIM_Rhsim05G0042200 [Rhododendron simsii]|uniref:TF-B3 domain-containing protein n=1 Tax=Rhododendron simsii TaxID=118357 RepID=A0A834GX11_RHOSS|nr:hypothetical protein RHSIM_Rhsim05G0042200 [Rhododendron simsii]
MEENSEEKNNNVESDDYPEEHNELAIAGFALVQCKYSKTEIDFQTAKHLNRGKSETHGGFLPLLPVSKEFIEALSSDEEFVLNLKVPEHGMPIDGLACPDFPRVKNIRDQIGKFGAPFEKQLTVSDVKGDQSRLTITKDLVAEFIDPMMIDNDEKELSRKVDGIPVLVYDSEGNQYEMKFKMWSGKSQVLTSGWKAFCNANKFTAHEDWITIWPCRHKKTQQLCFVILARRFPKIKQLVPKKSGNKRENASPISAENRKIKQTRDDS